MDIAAIILSELYLVFCYRYNSPQIRSLFPRLQEQVLWMSFRTINVIAQYPLGNITRLLEHPFSLPQWRM